LNECDIPPPMHYREILPDPRLRDLVKCYWSLEGWNSGLRTDRVLPDGCSELVLHYGEVFEQVDAETTQRQAPALLVGPSTRSTLIRPSRRVGIFAVRFRPGALPLLLSTPAAELCDSIQSTDQVGVRFGFDAIDAMGSLENHGRIRIIEQWLLERLGRTRLDTQVVKLHQQIDEVFGSLRVDDLARAAGWSVRQLQRRFQAATGLSPKLLARLSRLQHAWANVQEKVTFTRAAAVAGYADQAHFIREFRDFAGVSPSQYLRESNQLSDHFVGSRNPIP
jgi:AraC-like DNA-binding protein